MDQALSQYMLPHQKMITPIRYSGQQLSLFTRNYPNLNKCNESRFLHMNFCFNFLFQHFKHPLASNCSAASQYGQCALLSWTSNNFSSAIPKLDRRIPAAAEVHSSKVSKWFFHALFCVFCFVFSCKIVSPSHPLHSCYSTAR